MTKLVVRLKDLEGGQQPKNGVVRLTDLESPKKAAPKVDVTPRTDATPKTTTFVQQKQKVFDEMRMAPLNVIRDIQQKANPPEQRAKDSAFRRLSSKGVEDSAPVPQEKSKKGIRGTLKSVGQGLEDFQRRFNNTISFGATDAIDKKMGLNTQEEIDRSKHSFAGKAGEFTGYIGPGGAADAAANFLVRPLVKNAPAIVKGLTRPGTGSAIFQTADEARQALSGENNQTLGERAKDVAIAGGIGGGFGAAGPLAKQLGKWGTKTVTEALQGAQKPIIGAIDDTLRSGLPQTVKRGATAAGSRPVSMSIAPKIAADIPQIAADIPQIAADIPQIADNSVLAQTTSRTIDPKQAWETLNNHREKLIAELNALYDKGPRLSKAKQHQEKIDAINAEIQHNYKLNNQISTNEPVPDEVLKFLRSKQLLNEPNLTPFTAPRQTLNAATPELEVPKNGPVRLADLNNESPIVTQQGTAIVAQVNGPVRLADLTASETAAAQGTMGQRGNYANQLNNGNFSPELNQAIKSTDQSYEIAHNVDSVATANENVKNLTKAEADFHANESGGADHIATGYRLMQELDAIGEHQRALNVSNKLAKDLTKSGQTAQAAQILSRLSPEGQLLNLVRTAEKNGKTVTVADSVKFKELAAQVQDNSGAGMRENHINTILNRMEQGGNATPDELKTLGNFLDRANKVINPKETPIMDDLPKEFNDVKKRDKIISFLDGAEQSALARIQARKSRLNSLPLDEWKDHAIVVSAQIAKGTIKAATHVEDLVRMFGNEIRPYATQVFQQAQGMLKGVTRTAAAGNYEKASEALSRMSGEAAAQKAIVQETASHVKKLIADAKAGNLNADDIQKLRDYSDEIADMLDNNPNPRRIPTQEERFLQSVKTLAKKIAQVESEKIPANQANREVSSLLRQITKLADEGTPALKRELIDNNALSNIAHDVMEKTRPNPKPKTLQEKIVEKYLKENANVSQKDIATLRDLAKQVSRLSGDDAVNADMAMQQILNSYEKSSAWDKVQAIRYIDMLFNTGTQAVNAISGPIMATTGHVADVFGTMIDIVMNKALKTPRTTTLYGTNPLMFMARWFKGAKVGGKAGALGVNPAGIAGQNDIRGLTFKSLYNPLGLAERALGAVGKGADYATYSAVQQSEMRKIAFLDAKNRGVKGKENIQRHIGAFLNDPPPEAILQADRIGKNTTFQRSDSLGGKTANFLNSSPGPIKPLVGAVFPFVRTPINIASSAVTLTPGGIIKGLYQLTSKSDASRREAVRTLSLGLTGTGIGALGYYLSQLGIITGANDSGNRNVDDVREQVGQGQYRFNTSAVGRYLKSMINGEGPEAAAKAAKYRKGDKQFDYNKLQPLAFPLAIGAGLEGNKEKGVAGALQGAGADAYGSLYGMSTLKGVQDVFQPSYGGTMGEKALGPVARITESFFKSFSPSLLGQEARRQDPIQRKIGFNKGIIPDVKDYFMLRTPGLSQRLPPSKTTLGQNKLNAPGIKGQYLNPFRSDVAPYNEAAVIIASLIDSTGDEGLAPSPPAKTVKGKERRSGKQVTIAIPQQRYAKLQEEVGNEVARRILAIHQGLSDKRKAEMVTKIYETVNTKYRNIVKRELGIRISH